VRVEVSSVRGKENSSGRKIEETKRKQISETRARIESGWYQVSGYLVLWDGLPQIGPIVDVMCAVGPNNKK
jgi:hypothetical protein